MTLIYNKSSMKLRRRILRNNMTNEEKILWARINRNQIKGYKLRSQYSIDDYVVDFYCPKLKLAVEVDGENHSRKSMKEYDKLRQSIIEIVDICFFRVTNKRIRENIDSVIEELTNKVEMLSKSYFF